ncbi:MAG: histidine phosphotransferase ChpT [Maricaulaceae bacterium]
MTQPPISACDLAALLCARLCHDLVSPVGAIGSGLDVLDDPDHADMREEALDLVRTSARAALARLQFARLAFGWGGAKPGSLETQELQSLAMNMFSSAKAQISWRVTARGVPKPAGRVLLNLVLIAVESAPRGGEIVVEASDNQADCRLRVTASGPRAKLDPAVAEALDGATSEDGFNPKVIQAYYTGLIAREAGGRASAVAGDERVELAGIVPALTGMIG